MGESAKTLNPKKTVMMPDLSADCPMAHMVTVEDILNVKEKYPDVAVVCYVNSNSRNKSIFRCMCNFIKCSKSCKGITK